jgi:hypothetical protein
MRAMVRPRRTSMERTRAGAAAVVGDMVIIIAHGELDWESFRG